MKSQQEISLNDFLNLSETEFAAIAVPIGKPKVRRFVARKYDAIATKKKGQFGMNGQRKVVLHSISFSKANEWATEMRKQGYRIDLIEVETKVNEMHNFKVEKRDMEFNVIPAIPYIGSPSANPEFNQEYMENKWSARKAHEKAMELYRKAVVRHNPNCSDETIKVYRGLKLLFTCSNEIELMIWIENNKKRIAYPNVVFYFPKFVYFNHQIVEN